MELIEMETLPKGFEKLGREVKVRNSHKRLLGLKLTQIGMRILMCLNSMLMIMKH